MPQKKNRIIDVKKAFNSFKYALNGIKLLILGENNFRIHILAAVVVITMGLYFSIKKIEWLWLLLFIALVLVTEAINTVIEALVDWQSLEKSHQAKKIKDIAAGAVLIAAIIALIGGVLIFYDYIIALF